MTASPGGTPRRNRSAARRPALASLGALALMAGILPRATAQEAEPLTKTELVRFLSGGVYAPAELAALVRRSCLSFEPTDRDREDLRSLGGGEPLMEAIEWCSRPLDVSVEPAGLTLRAGQSGAVTLRASRGGEPVGGVGLALASGGGGSGPSAVTDERGVVRLSVPAAGQARSYRLPVRATGARIAGDPAVSVRVVAGPPRSASLSPPIVLLDAGADTATTVRAALRDQYGNAVVDVPVSLTDPATGFGVSAGRTRPGGDVELRIEPGTVVENGLLELRAEGRVLGELTVRVVADVEAEDAAAVAATPQAPPDPSDEDEEPPAAAAARETRRDSAARETGGLEDARALASRGDIDGAVAAYRAAIESSPNDVALRLELARLLDRENRLADARAAYREVADVSPGNVEASRALARLEQEGTVVDASVAGGSTLEGSPSLRGAEISVRPIRFLRVWGRYDRSLGVDGVPLIRGPDEIEGYFGGVALSWGEDRLFTTSVEVGRRIDDITPQTGTAETLDQNTIHVEQRALVPAGRGYAALSAGGYLGRWFDRDDWLAYARVRVPVGDGIDIAPAVFTGETVGTDIGTSGRSAERETRVELPIRLGTAGVWFVEPAGAVGWVAGDDDEPTERLYEARLLAEVLVTEGIAIRVFGRHQRAPGLDPFTLAAAGLRIRFD